MCDEATSSSESAPTAPDEDTCAGCLQLFRLLLDLQSQVGVLASRVQELESMHGKEA